MGKFKIGFIGCGHMGEAMVSGFIHSKRVSKHDIHIHTKTTETSLNLKEKYKINVEVSNRDVVQKSKYIFLAVKPNLYQDIFNEINDVLTSDKVIISITPSYTLNELNQMANFKSKVVRTIPNTPSMYNLGFTSVVFNQNEDDEVKTSFNELINLLGSSLEIKEDKIAILSTLSGSAPALIYMFADAFVSYGLKNGLDEKEARLIFSKTLTGSSKMIETSDEELQKLVSNVCSPNGSTIVGVKSLNDHNFTKIMEESLEKITLRFIEMNQNK